METKNLTRSARRITLILFLTQSMASAGFIAAATINSILGAKLSGNPAWAGAPSAVYLLGSAFGASIWGFLMDLMGRRNVITTGLFSGVIGTVFVLYSISTQSFYWLLGGMVLMGMANAAVVLGRFAAAEVHPPQERGRAISNVVIGGTLGSVFGPLLVGPSGTYLQTLGMDELAGAYTAGFALLITAAFIVFSGLRPDPRDLGRKVAELYPDKKQDQNGTRTLLQIIREPAAFLAITAMVLGQVVMVAIMVITSLHMRDHQHQLSDISLVISSHTFGMYAFSIISGRLVDRWGRGQVILTGAAVLLVACLLTPLSPQVLPLAFALFLLGLGWNFCFVGGSTLLADQLSPTERARTQGVNDFLVGMASAVGSLSSGLIFSLFSYALVAIVGIFLSVVPILLAWRWLLQQKRSLASSI